MLDAFSVENYRAFARRQDIEVRPLTLFFGWNSGGKSALVRFLPLVAESVRVGGPPIWLAGEVGRRSTWPELVCKATERVSLSFSLHWKGESELDADWEIVGDLQGSWQEAKSLIVSVNGKKSTLTTQEISDSYWQGLTPSLAGGAPSSTNITELVESLDRLSKQVQWVSGVRVRPPRIITYGGGAPSTLSPDGGDAVDHLIAAKLRNANDPLINTIERFFLALGEELVLDNPIDGAWRIMLQPTVAAKIRINLCDTGEGYSQVLPVLVALARSRNGGPKLVCLEQPELHLHTRAQVELANFLVESAMDGERPRILVETHSEVILTSVQLAIAEGRIPPEKVRVYWVEASGEGTSEAVAVDFDGQGRPLNSALSMAFNEVVELSQKLLVKQMPREPI